jgi:GMP synthase (glutamine-hydrolysing)
MRKLLAVLTVLLWAVQVSAAEKASLDELWTKIYDRPKNLASLSRPAVLYLDIQHAEIVRRSWEKQADPLTDCHVARMRRLFKGLSGLDCVAVHVTEVGNAFELDQAQIKAILISGRSTTEVNTEAQDAAFYPWIRTTKIPMIGFCGGCQLIGKAYGMKVVFLRKLRPGERDPAPGYHPGVFKEKGFLPVQVGKQDPLFAGLSQGPVFKQSHALQLSDVPPGFDLLASSPDCRVEAMKHRDRLVYGVQFHPEGFDADHADGETLLKNFFGVAITNR